MRMGQLQAIYKELVPSLLGYAPKGSLLFISPIGHILRGYYFEGSDFDPMSFYVWVFMLPLYIPAKHLSFNFGKRLTGGYGGSWSLKEISTEDIVNDLLKAMKREGSPFLETVATPEKFATKALEFSDNPNDPYLREAIAYSFILANRQSEAGEALDLLSAILVGTDQQKAWTRDMLRRANSLRKHLVQEPEETKKSLMQWEKQTLVNLKLESFSESFRKARKR